MPDQLVSVSAPDVGIAIVAAITTDFVRDIRTRHDLSPLASATTGRLATAATLFGSSLKGGERVTLQINGDGPIGSVNADAWLLDAHTVGARAYAQYPFVDLPLNARGKFDVAGAVGTGTLAVTKSYAVGQPYNSVVPLYSGEIAEDVASYLVNSEQIPSVVALGVLASPEGVVAAGGILAQVLPGADERAVVLLEEHAMALPPLTSLIHDGANADALIDALAASFEKRARREYTIAFACTCSRDKVKSALVAMGADELRALAAERPTTEAICEFCRKAYEFSSDDVKQFADEIA